MVPAFVEHLPDHVDQRDVLAQGLGEDALAFFDIGFDEAAAEVGELDVAFLEDGEAEQLQRFTEREEVVDLGSGGSWRGRASRLGLRRVRRPVFPSGPT